MMNVEKGHNGRNVVVGGGGGVSSTVVGFSDR